MRKTHPVNALKKLGIGLAFGAATIMSMPTSALACTQMYMGKNLTADGNTYYGRTEDIGTRYLKHYGIEVLTQLISDLHAAKTGSLLWSENIVEINKQISDIACQERLLAQLKQQAVVDPDIFIFQSNQLAEQRREARLKKSRILRSEDDQTVQRTQELLDILEDGPDLLMTFDEALFSELVETITIQDNSTIRFRLINRLELPEHIERKK